MKLFIDPDWGCERGYEPLDEYTDVSVRVHKVGMRYNVIVQIWRNDYDAVPAWNYDGHFCTISKANGCSICSWDNGIIQKGEIRFMHIPTKPERLVIEDKRFVVEYTNKNGKEIFAGV